MNDTTKETVLPTATVGQSTYSVEASESNNMEQIRNTVRALRSEPEALEQLEDPVKLANMQRDWEEFKQIVVDMIEDIHKTNEESYEYLLKNAIDKFAYVVLSDTLKEGYQKEILKRVLTKS